jgi:hypothetical protein
MFKVIDLELTRVDFVGKPVFMTIEQALIQLRERYLDTNILLKY